MRSLRWLPLLLPLLTLVPGCGHPASGQGVPGDRRAHRAPLELRKDRQPDPDAKAVGEQIDETKKALASNTLKDCVGKRITERAMQCVRTAKTSSQIVDDCFR